MTTRSATITKITRPKVGNVCLRKKLFQRMDAGQDCPVTWVAGPPGSGKTTLVTSYLDSRRISCLWYQVDGVDADIASFFYYMSMAAKEAFSGKRRRLPLLTPEYLSDVPSFSRRYFETLYANLKPPFTIVFDNYQDAPDESGLHDVINAGLSIVPEGIHAIVISRNEPLPVFSRLRANNGMHVIGWNELRLTVEESREIVRMKDRKSITNEMADELHKKVDGWAAGLALMVEVAKTRHTGYPVLKELTPQEIFDYFASEVLGKTDKQTQSFLVKTAFLPRMTALMAERLTGVHDAEQILSGLNKNHYFTTQYGYHAQGANSPRGAALQDAPFSGPQEEKKRSSHALPAYQYHPLFREFLLSKAKGFYNEEELLQTKRSAAGVLEASEMVEDAVSLLIDVRDWDTLAKLILGRAAGMTAQGRSKTLEEWLLSLPREMMESTPWLLYWFGACRLSFNPTESRRCFDAAFQQFQAHDDQTGMWLSWSFAVDTIFYAWEDISPLSKYAGIFHEIYRKEIPFPSLSVESRVVSCRFIIMVMWEMHHPEISAWAERVLTLVQQSHDAHFRLQIGYYLAIYYLWTGDFIQGQIVADFLKKDSRSVSASPLLSLFGRAIESMYACLSGSIGHCLITVSDGLEFARETGVHIWDNQLIAHGGLAALSAGDIGTLSDLIGKMELSLPTTKKIDVSYYYYLSSGVSLLKGDLPSAARYIELAVKAVTEIGSPFPIAVCHFWAAQILFELGKVTEAEARLNIASRIGRQLKSRHLEFMCLLADAQFALDMRTREGEKCGDMDIRLQIANVAGSNKHSAIQNQKSEIAKRGLKSLRSGMELGREQGYVNMHGWRSNVMSMLCLKALDVGIEVDYVRRLIRKRNLIPDNPPICSENWPWPVKIFALGHFMILTDDKPIQFTGKVQQKPLEMLKAILSIGCGGAPEGQLIDALWPGTEGDSAHKSFEITLHRLRRLLNNDKAIIRQGGLVTLDERYCWVDIQAFERMAENSEEMCREIRKQVNRDRASVPDFPTGEPFPPVSPMQAEMLRLVEKTVNLYEGSFLPTETLLAWTASVRERLRDKFRKLVITLGAHLEQTGQWENAAERYRWAIEKDSLAEAVYQCLMICYRQLGQRARGIEVYRRLKNTLSASFNITPSPLTESIHQSLR